ncbi:MAG TPA: response regulator transcription factor [Acetobacteraceae bacterium]|nr:response regulator transcription factor [Acetobacteraceae bacterium]
MSLRVRLLASDPIRHRGLAAMVEQAGFIAADEAPDVVLCDLATGAQPPAELDAPVLVLTDAAASAQVAGVLPRSASAAQLDAALRAVAARLLVRAQGALPAPGFRSAEDAPSLTAREAEILVLVGQGLSNKGIARRLGISVHTVKFHLEALFEKIGATSRAEAVVLGLRHGVIEL